MKKIYLGLIVSCFLLVTVAVVSVIAYEIPSNSDNNEFHNLGKDIVERSEQLIQDVHPLYEEGIEYATRGYKYNDETSAMEHFPNKSKLDNIMVDVISYLDQLNKNISDKEAWKIYGDILEPILKCYYLIYEGMDNGLKSMIDHKFVNQNQCDRYIDFINKNVIDHINKTFAIFSLTTSIQVNAGINPYISMNTAYYNSTHLQDELYARGLNYYLHEFNANMIPNWSGYINSISEYNISPNKDKEESK